MYCEGSDIVLIVTDIDHHLDKSFIYMVNRGLLQRVPFSDEDTLRVVIPTQVGPYGIGRFGTYEITTGVERRDGTSSLNNTVRALYLPTNGFRLASAFSEGNYYVYADSIQSMITYRQGQLTYSCLPMPTSLGGRDDAFALERRYFDGDRRDTLFLRCDEGEHVQRFSEYSNQDISPHQLRGTAHRYATADELRRENVTGLISVGMHRMFLSSRLDLLAHSRIAGYIFT